MNKLIKFKFKGKRNYIQGGDIFDQVNCFIPDDEYIKNIVFKTFTRKDCFLKTVSNDIDKVIATIKTNKSNYVLVETDFMANIRLPYDEDFLLLNSGIVDDTISMKFNTRFTLIENIIALTKKLNYSIESNISGKWLFGQLKLTNQFPKEIKDIHITSTRRISNKFSENRIDLDGVNYGKIMFIVGNP